MTSNRVFATFLAGLCVVCLHTSVLAQTARARATFNVDLQARLKEAESDPRLAEALLKTGRKVAAVCDNCHGVGGNSPTPDTPNLAGQNPAYHLEQLHQYAVGQRRDVFMEGMIKVLNSDEKVGMVLFYASQQVARKPVSNRALVARGQEIYGKACMRCHDENGHGDEKLARVAGQQPVYLTTALKRYRSRTGSRLNVQMAAKAQTLTDADIDAVVAFVSSME